MAATPSVYLVFGGRIIQQSVWQLVNSIFAASQQVPAPEIHLLFQSFGGVVGDGVWLYNVLRTCPVPLTAYNAGCVESIGVIAFLGAQRRIVSKHGAFMLHSTSRNLTNATAEVARAAVASLGLDDRRTEAILTEHVSIADSQWASLRNNELWLGAEDAVRSGFAHEIGEFCPQPGAKIYTVGGVG